MPGKGMMPGVSLRQNLTPGTGAGQIRAHRSYCARASRLHWGLRCSSTPGSAGEVDDRLASRCPAQAKTGVWGE